MKRHNITKNDILEKIHRNIGIPIQFSEEIFLSILEIIVEGLNRDGKVKLSNFGTFRILKKKSRIGRNPKTKKSYTIEARNVVAFTPSPSLKRKIND